MASIPNAEQAKHTIQPLWKQRLYGVFGLLSMAGIRAREAAEGTPEAVGSMEYMAAEGVQWGCVSQGPPASCQSDAIADVG
jgi:hypothetical protein